MVRIAKQLACQKFIMKIHSARLRQSRWRLTLPLSEARKNDEVIAIADSQIFRWLDQINGVEDADAKAREIKAGIKELRTQENSVRNKREIRRLYDELDTLQFQPDYMCLIIDKEKDYYRATHGFSINGIRYVRLLGTNGGIKNSTIVFVSERVAPELKRRIENGRRPDAKLVPAKLEAYKALTCSASNAVSFPRGVIVVPDVTTSFKSDVVYLTDEGDGEPTMEMRYDEPLEIDASDGFGLMLPSLAERWSRELGLSYVTSGVNTRWVFEKGMVFTFDFVEFAERIANRYKVIDAWGVERDIRDAELILTTSMLKLWDSYDSIEDLIEKSNSNGYTFGVSKTCPASLENERRLNYQFIQPFRLTPDDVDDLIAPTIRETDDVLSGDWRSAVLYLKGTGLTDRSFERSANDYVKGLMVDPSLHNDPFVRTSIYSMIRKRINEAKVGVVKVHGNYSIVCGDPYLLCQSIFGLPLTGLLRPGEIYNAYWADTVNESLICFRAPMSCAENIRRVTPVRSDEARYWYRYIKTGTIFNGWDTACMALNGCDFDGDLVMLTDNEVLLRRFEELPALMCIQRKAPKTVPTENDFIRSNIESFGNEIGQTTNWITSMYEVRAGFPQESREYKTLSYRIRAGQLYQQNAIDKAKGIICKPMPKTWYSRHEINKLEDESERMFYRSISAERKPYFMRYIYPELMKSYNKYVKNCDSNSYREFRMGVEELDAIPRDQRTDRQNEFLYYYYKGMPVGTNDCVMNIICRRFEQAFDKYVSKHRDTEDFDYTRMKYPGVEYSARQYQSLKKIYDIYNARMRSFAIYQKYENIDEYETMTAKMTLDADFRRECDTVCPDRRTLCNIILDICYQKSSTKAFAWAMCGREMIENLLDRNGRKYTYPVASPTGDFEFAGQTFTLKTVEVDNDDSIE